jgi:hypothetical protein
MRASPEIELELEFEKQRRLRRARPFAATAPAAPPPALWIEALAPGSERPGEPRGRIAPADALLARALTGALAQLRPRRRKSARLDSLVN